VDYFKYALKEGEALEQAWAGKDRFLVLGCGACFKEFDSFEEAVIRDFAEQAVSRGKEVTGCIQRDFLCNKVQTEAAFANLIPAGTEGIFVVACGLGIQTVADLTDLPVYAATDSLNYGGQHGMALTEKICGACGQCFLNLTGGICPVVDCSKGLVNGQCGGAKNGSCELDPEKDCAWEKIRRRLSEQGRLDVLRNQPVQIRDYSVTNSKMIRDYVREIRAKRFEGFYGGVHPEEKKDLTAGLALRGFPEPERVVIPLSMHAGAPADPLVQPGDHVDAGQLIGAAHGFISCNVHASVSGTVEAVEPRVHPGKGPGVLSVVIRSDGKQTLHASVYPAPPLSELCPEEIVEIVRDKGITGMGGAGFPAYVKLMPGKPIDTVLINGSECEPYLTADHRVLLEYPDRVLFGLQAIMKAVGAERGIVVIEDNQPDAVQKLREAIEESGAECISRIEICVAKTQYPEGAEKMLIKRVLNRKVPGGALPADVGCVVSNVSTAKAISDALRLGLPPIERAVTVTGEYIAHPANYMVKIGTEVQRLIDACGGIKAEAQCPVDACGGIGAEVPEIPGGDRVTLKMGGPMMGTTLTDTHVPIIKGSGGIIAIPAKPSVEQTCIRCGRCVDVCPMELSPMLLARYTESEQPEMLLKLNIGDCFSCKCCEYICSSGIRLVDRINRGKQLILPLLKK